MGEHATAGGLAQERPECDGEAPTRPASSVTRILRSARSSR